MKLRRPIPIRTGDVIQLDVDYGDGPGSVTRCFAGCFAVVTEAATDYVVAYVPSPTADRGAMPDQRIVIVPLTMPYRIGAAVLVAADDTEAA